MNVDEAIANAERLAEWCDRPSNQTDVTAAIAQCSQAFSLLALAKIARGGQ